MSSVTTRPPLPATGATDLDLLCAGFADPVRDSQVMFRSVLQAMSHPGRLVPIATYGHWPALQACGGHPSAAAVLLTLLDAESTLWLSPSRASSGIQTWLRFHTGCLLLEHPHQAQFVWAASLAELPPLTDLACGSDVSPETASTCLVDVPQLHCEPDRADWILSGPGIADRAYLGLPGSAPSACERLHTLRVASHSLFPRGPDLLLASATHLVGLPRSTQLTRCHASPPAPILVA